MTDTITVDVDPNGWTFAEQVDYRKKVGVNPHYAVMIIGRALSAGDEAEFANIDPTYLLGLAWTAQRRDDADLTIESVAEHVDYQSLLDAVVEWAVAHAPDPQTAPNRAARRVKPSTPRKTTSPTKQPSSTSASASRGGAETT